ncbi:MAG TPA: hypothetical protein VK966_07170 [Longimicrobiales bacterium]|nr:hypothetical protein [Longimicrobiales bacterium]
MPYLAGMRGTLLFRRLRAGAVRRTGLGVLALSFTLVGSGDVTGQHHCAHHSSMAAPAVADGGQASGHVPSDAHGRHAADTGGHQEGGHDAGPCTCIGTCHGSAATPLPPPAALSPLHIAGALHLGGLVPVGSPAVQRLPYVLPFPNGPPAHG